MMHAQKGLQRTFNELVKITFTDRVVVNKDAFWERARAKNEEDKL